MKTIIMKKSNKILATVILTLLMLAVLTACTTNIGNNTTPNEDNGGNQTMNLIYIHVNNTVLTAELENNSSAQALVNLLQQGDITIDMNDYASFEKVGDIGTSLPRNDTNITTQAGDLILYLGRYFVIYYDTNSYSLTRLGKIQGVTQAQLKALLGSGDVTVVLSLNTK